MKTIILVGLLIYLVRSADRKKELKQMRQVFREEMKSNQKREKGD